LYATDNPARIETVGQEQFHLHPKDTMNPQLRAASFDDFDFDTITVSQALPWFHWCLRDSCRLHHCRRAWPVRAVVGEPAEDAI
jgi:hypothetical protein